MSFQSHSRNSRKRYSRDPDYDRNMPINEHITPIDQKGSERILYNPYGDSKFSNPKPKYIPNKNNDNTFSSTAIQKGSPKGFQRNRSTLQSPTSDYVVTPKILLRTNAEQIQQIATATVPEKKPKFNGLGKTESVESIHIVGGNGNLTINLEPNPLANLKSKADYKELTSTLQEIYSTIWKQEKESSRRINQMKDSLKSSQNNISLLTEELWLLCKFQVSFLESYHDFLFYAYRGGLNEVSNPGPGYVSKYQIPLRLRKFGILRFLEVLKQVKSAFIDNEVSAFFISRSFDILSTLLDSPFQFSEIWAETIADISRSAITMYNRDEIDWKVSAKYWYSYASRYLLGSGKLYYHQALVSQERMEILTLLSKATISRDPYNISISMIFSLLPNNTHSYEPQSEQFISNFLSIHSLVQKNAENIENTDSTIDLAVDNFNECFGNMRLALGDVFFHETLLDKQSFSSCLANDDDNHTFLRLGFWFQQATSLFIINNARLFDFGSNGDNPFSMLFGLVRLKALPEQDSFKIHKHRDKNYRDEKNDGYYSLNFKELSLEDHRLIELINKPENEWISRVKDINPQGLVIAFLTLAEYMTYPISVGSPHILLWLYFLNSLSIATTICQNAKPLIDILFGRLFCWDLLVDYLGRIRNAINSDKEERPATETPTNCDLQEVKNILGIKWMDLLDKGSSDNGIDGLLPTDCTLNQTNETDFNFVLNRKIRYKRILELAENLANVNAFGICMNEDMVISVDANSWKCLRKKVSTSSDVIIENYFNTKIFSTLKTQFNELLTTSQRLDNRLNEVFDETQNKERTNALEQHIKTTTFIFDTNMWLKHSSSIYRLIEQGEINCMIPVIVYSELRHLKYSKDIQLNEISSRAAFVVKQLLKMKMIAILNIDGEEIRLNDITGNTDHNSHLSKLLKQKNDDLIIDGVNKYQNTLRLGLVESTRTHTDEESGKTPIKNCALITEDRNMRLKTVPLNIECFSRKWFLIQFVQLV